LDVFYRKHVLFIDPDPQTNSTALEALEKRGAKIARIPYSIRTLLGNLLRTQDAV